MNIYELKVKVYTLNEIPLSSLSNCIMKFIDGAMSKEQELLDYHNEKTYKHYCFDSLYPLERDEVYKKDKIYNFRIRTINKEFATYILEKTVNHFDKNFKALTVDIRKIAKRPIEKIYSISPVLFKNDAGYWKNSIGIDAFEKRLVDNLIKKYKYFTGNDLDEDFIFYNAIEFVNRKPVPIKYKEMVLRGDKLDLVISSDPRAQELAYLAIGIGLGENNSRGCGFVGYKFL